MQKILKNLQHNPPKEGIDYKTHILTVVCKEDFESFEAAHKLYLKPPKPLEPFKKEGGDEKTNTSAGETAPKDPQGEGDAQKDTLPLTERKELMRHLDFEATEAAQKQHEDLTLYVVMDPLEEAKDFCNRLVQKKDPPDCRRTIHTHDSCKLVSFEKHIKVTGEPGAATTRDPHATRTPPLRRARHATLPATTYV